MRGPGFAAFGAALGRLSRLAGLAGLAAGVGGRSLPGAARELAVGRHPALLDLALPDLALTPGNAQRLARQLAGMRGAAAAEAPDMMARAGAILRRPVSEPATDAKPAGLRDRALAPGSSQPALPVPPFDLLLIHRKLGGLCLLAGRLRGRIDLQAAQGRYR